MPRATASAPRSRPGPTRSTHPTPPRRTPSARRAAGRSRGTSTRRASSAASRRSSARRCGPRAWRRRRTRTGSQDRRSRGRASAGARPCTGSAGSASAPARRAERSACRTGSRPRRARTRRTSPIPASTGTTHTVRSRSSRAVQRDRQRAVAGEHEQPEQQRPLLPTPERTQRVRRRERAVRVRGDVGEREVVTHERDGEDGRCDRGRAERAEERVACRDREPSAVVTAAIAPATSA